MIIVNTFLCYGYKKGDHVVMIWWYGIILQALHLLQNGISMAGIWLFLIENCHLGDLQSPHDFRTHHDWSDLNPWFIQWFITLIP